MTDRDNLIEAMARAICLEFYNTAWEATSAFRRLLCRSMAKQALDALTDRIPGLADMLDSKAVIVPREATEEMLDAWQDRIRTVDDVKGLYAAMLAASPLQGGDA